MNSLYNKILFPIIIIGILFALLAGYIVNKQHESSIAKELENEVKSIAYSLTAVAEAIDSSGHLSRAIDTLSFSNEIEFLAVLSIDPLKVIVSNKRKLNKRKVSSIDFLREIDFNKAITSSESEFIKTDNKMFFLLPFASKNEGMVIAVANINKYKENISMSTNFDVLIIMFISILMASILFLFIKILIFKPLLDIHNIIQLRADNESHVYAKVYANDEIGSLAKSLNNLFVNVTYNENELEYSKKTAEDANLTKSLFLANMSHEIRAPITIILGFSEELLEDQSLSNEQKDYLVKIKKNSSHLLNIINDILDLSKIEANQIETEEMEFDLKLLLQGIKDMVKPLALAKKLEFEFNLNSKLPKFIFTDPTKLKQIMINILSNSIKFTSSGYVHCDIFWFEAEKEICFLFKDTGIGIEEEQQKSMFKSFKQADNSITRKYGGTGLGLSICKYLAMRLGGDVELSESTPNKLTIFKLSLREIKVITKETFINLDENIVTKEINLSIHETIRPNLKILVAEDSPDNQVLISILLKKISAEIKMTNNGKEAIDAIADFSPDIILMDIQMPVMDGITAIKEIKNNNIKIPVLALTANVMDSDIKQYLSIGFKAVVGKPINRKEFFKKIADLVKT